MKVDPVKKVAKCEFCGAEYLIGDITINNYYSERVSRDTSALEATKRAEVETKASLSKPRKSAESKTGGAKGEKIGAIGKQLGRNILKEQFGTDSNLPQEILNKIFK